MYNITQIKAGSNCYLVSQEDSSILIDTGLKGNEKKILEACQGKNVKLIVLTHGHIDHIQNAAYLAKQLQVPIAMHKSDVVLIQNNLCREMKSKGFLGNIVRFFSVMSAKHTVIQSFIPEVILKEGDKLLKYGIDGEVLELPGHTEGSIGIMLGNNLFVGDALMNMFGPGESLLYENYEEMQKSAKKITDEGKKIIYFGHGKAVENRRWVR
ncbi:MBL fold metallo-hydrolase [Inconstantimicrobium mannanitabidum]|uniref:MBL fold metallo-hydrolase n=1 Tax=Inconstantimicrobium mannanitabidum TaxID=1604901 RepID=A0ACB5RGH6_9CLOT|nr:MBL fold metallo-hydrolase [Clostridium sp. TW13]GKX68167.1 MBL fold metallo-hydrolase [Clostridium sp. TW13]